MAEGQPRSESQPQPGGLIAAAIAGALIAAGGVVWGGVLAPWTWWHLAGGLLIGGSGGWLAAYDAATHRLPNRVTYPTAVGLAVLITAAGLFGVAGAFRALGWGMGLGLLFLVLALAANGGLGLGDVKLSVILGAWTGWLAPSAPLVFLVASFLAGGAAALTLMALRRASRHSQIAFGPFLVVGALVATWWAGA